MCRSRISSKNNRADVWLRYISNARKSAGRCQPYASASVKKVYSYPCAATAFLERQGLRQNLVATAVGDARHAAFPLFP
jgi:hypothetical protein